MIDLGRYFQYAKNLRKFKGIFELSLPTLEKTVDIPILLGVFYVNISVSLGLNVLDGNNAILENVIRHL